MIKVGTVRSMANAAILMAMEKGYFKEVGIKVELEDLQSSATAMASLAQGQLNIIAGGVSAGYFNALEKNLPIIITVDRVTTPIRHNLMIRADLKDQIKEIKDLKGKVIASNAPGSISTYEIGKILAKARAFLRRRRGQEHPVPAICGRPDQQGGRCCARPSRRSPTTSPTRASPLPFAEADEIVEPSPMTIAVNLTNTDWAKANQQLVRNYYVALMRGVRDYCQAYHGGAIRKELIDLLVRTGTEQQAGVAAQISLAGAQPRTASSISRACSTCRTGTCRTTSRARNLRPSGCVDNSYVDYANAEARSVRAGEQGEHARGLPVKPPLPRLATRRERIMRMLHSAIAALAIAGGTASAAAQQHTVRIGMVRALSATPTMIAIEKGYFKEYGIKAEVSDVDTTALVPLAQNLVQVMEAGVTAGYFNALEKNFPITIATDRVASPIGHKLLIRPDLKDRIKTIADLKGKIIATNATASVTNYEIGHILASAGLTLKDIELKVLPFPQMSVALANKAVDGAIVIPPWVYQVIDQGIGDGARRPRRPRQSRSDEHRGGLHQHRLGEAEPGCCAQLLRRPGARHPRLLPGLSQRTEPPGGHRHRRPHRRRAPPGAAVQVSLAGARSQRAIQHGEPARHPVVLPEGRLVADAVPSRAPRHPGIFRFRRAEARAVRGREQGQQAAGLPVTQRMAVERRGAAIEIAGLRKEYVSAAGRVLALDDIDLRIAPGEFVCIVGPSGCGKSTLLRILAGLDTQTGGTIKVEAPGWAVQNAMVFQESGLFPWMSVEANVALRPDDPRRTRRRGGRAGRGRARSSSASPSSAGTIRTSSPAACASAARSRAPSSTDPGMLLMDEPFAALDAQNRVILQAELVRIWEQTRKTVVYITHSIEEALLLGDRTVVMTAQPGRIKQIIDVPFPHPRNLMTLSASAEFGKLKLDIWRVLEDEVMRARAEAER